MTTYEIVTTALLWVILGFWIVYKSNWLRTDFTRSEAFWLNLATVLLSPLFLLFAMYREFVKRKWYIAKSKTERFPITSSEIDAFEVIYSSLVNVHDYEENLEHMVRFRQAIDRAKLAREDESELF